MAGQYTTPTICVGPVRSHCPPIITSFSCATAPAAKYNAAAAAAKGIMLLENLFIALLPLLSPGSIRKWPYPEVVSDVSPQAVEPLRFDHQEEDDQAAEQDQPQIGDDVRQIRLREDQTAEGFEKPTSHDRQQDHEDRAQDRAEDRAEPADDHHSQLMNLNIDLKLPVIGDT